MVIVRWEVQVPEELPHEAFHLNQVAQRIGFGRIDSAGVAHLCEKLGHDIVVALDLVGQ